MSETIPSSHPGVPKKDTDLHCPKCQSTASTLLLIPGETSVFQCAECSTKFMQMPLSHALKEIKPVLPVDMVLQETNGKMELHSVNIMPSPTIWSDPKDVDIKQQIVESVNRCYEEVGIERHETGAKRSSDANDVRFDLIPQVALEMVAKVLATGAKRYGEHNWRKGFKYSQVMNHLLRHLNLLQKGDTSENHIAHALCNLMFLAEYTVIHPELNDLLKADDYLPEEVKAANIIGRNL